MKQKQYIKDNERLSQNIRKYYTYDNFGIVTKHRFLLFAIIKAKYQAWILGVDSYVDLCLNDEIYNSPLKSIRYYKCFLPFKRFVKHIK